MVEFELSADVLELEPDTQASLKAQVDEDARIDLFPGVGIDISSEYLAGRSCVAQARKGIPVSRGTGCVFNVSDLVTDVDQDTGHSARDDGTMLFVVVLAQQIVFAVVALADQAVSPHNFAEAFRALACDRVHINYIRVFVCGNDFLILMCNLVSFANSMATPLDHISASDIFVAGLLQRCFIASGLARLLGCCQGGLVDTIRHCCYAIA